jgi:predicted nucleic acid-binding protein
MAAELVAITEKIAACRDSTDDKFLELAVGGHADFILTGDADLLTLNPFRGIPIVNPATFVQGASR